MNWIYAAGSVFRGFVTILAAWVVMMIVPSITPWQVFLILILGSLSSSSKQFAVDFLTAATGKKAGGTPAPQGKSK